MDKRNSTKLKSTVRVTDRATQTDRDRETSVDEMKRRETIRGREKRTVMFTIVCVGGWVQVFKLLVGGYCDVQ